MLTASRSETHGIISQLHHHNFKLLSVKKQLFQLTSDLANAEAGLARSVLLLANVEENTGLAQALHHLAETEGHVADLHALQAEAHTCHLVEYSRELLGMVQACKVSFPDSFK